MYEPLNYSQLTLADGAYIPSMVKNRNNLTYAYWERSLFQRAASNIIIETPDEWDGSIKDFLIYCLFRFGYVAISEDAENGRFFQPCSLRGYNLYYQPTNALISNPLMHKDLIIGKECELLKLTPDYKGIFDIIGYYAEKLSLLDNALNMSLINNKFAFLIASKNKAAGQALKKMLDKINSGEPAVIFDQKLVNDQTDKDMPWQFLERSNLKQSYLTTDQLMDMQTIINAFDAEVGIPTVPYQKKERMVADEATSKALDATSRSTVWLETLNTSIDAIKKLYPDIKLSATLRYNPEEQKGEIDNGNNNTSRTISI